MSDLKPADRSFLEKLLEMGGGYVLSFNNATFADFVRGSTGEDIYDEKYSNSGTSKANRLRAFWQIATNDKVAALLGDVLTKLIDDDKVEAEGTQANRVKSMIAYLRGQSHQNGLAGPRPSTTQTGAIRAFISYSVQQKREGAKVKSCLADLGYECFLAHDDMNVSEKWRQRILEELRVADVFVALLSADFKQSDWCGQELGFIVSRSDALVIPLMLDETPPYGFIAELNGRSVGGRNLAAVLEGVLLEYRPRHVIPARIRRVAKAKSYNEAEVLVQSLAPHFERFSDREVDEFARAVTGNDQVWGAWRCESEFIPKFVRAKGALLQSDVAAQLRAVLPEIVLPPNARGS